MTFTARFIQVVFLLLFLAVYDVFIKDFWKLYLITKGVDYGLGQGFIGYGFVLVPAFIVAYMVNRKIKAQQQS